MSFTHFPRIFAFSRFAISPLCHRFRLPRDAPFLPPFAIVTCLSANCSVFRSLSFSLSHLKQSLKWRQLRCSSLNAFTTLFRYTGNIHIHMCYITLAWHRLQVLLQGQVWVAIKAHFKNNNAESFRSCASYITCECPLAPHRGRVCCESWHKYSNLWLRKGFTWASKQPSQAERLAWLP